ncbi:hypothetical protein ACWCQN_46080 [Streptomyces sp. NPDC001984]|uniref:hypothetical protein n=1 Tax=Streptomyces sp. NPDC002619 TaxID=3364655 RepID=UPI0036C97A74
MTRYVHHQLIGVAMAVCACVVSAPVAFGVRGIPAVVDDTVWRVILLMLGCNVLFGMLEASRLKWVSEVRTFEEAVPLEHPEILRRADYSLRHNLVNKGLLPVLLVPTLAMGLALSPWLSLTPLSMSRDWLIRAGIAARWEKRNAVLLWGDTSRTVRGSSRTPRSGRRHRLEPPPIHRPSDQPSFGLRELSQVGVARGVPPCDDQHPVPRAPWE